MSGAFVRHFSGGVTKKTHAHGDQSAPPGSSPLWKPYSESGRRCYTPPTRVILKRFVRKSLISATAVAQSGMDQPTEGGDERRKTTQDSASECLKVIEKFRHTNLHRRVTYEALNRSKPPSISVMRYPQWLSGYLRLSTPLWPSTAEYLENRRGFLSLLRTPPRRR